MPALIVDPELLAAVTRQFNLKGDLAPFTLTENVVPIFDIGRLIGITEIQKVATPGSQTAVRVGANSAFHLTTGHQASAPADWFDDSTLNPAAGTVLADTGQLAAGIRMIWGSFAMDDVTQIVDAALQWRNAANDANVGVLQITASGEAPYARVGPLFVDVSLNERFRWVSGKNVMVGTARTWISDALTNPSIA